MIWNSAALNGVIRKNADYAYSTPSRGGIEDANLHANTSPKSKSRFGDGPNQ